MSKGATWARNLLLCPEQRTRDISILSQHDIPDPVRVGRLGRISIQDCSTHLAGQIANSRGTRVPRDHMNPFSIGHASAQRIESSLVLEATVAVRANSQGGVVFKNGRSETVH